MSNLIGTVRKRNEMKTIAIAIAKTKRKEKKRKDTATLFSRWLPLSDFTVAQQFNVIIDTEGTGGPS